MDLSPQSRLEGKIADRTAVVGIIGLGYVGLPLALVFAKKGFSVLGFDVDRSKVDALARGECYIRQLDPEDLTAAREAGFQATGDLDRLREVDAILICVPTPLTAHRDPDLSYVRSTGEEIARRLRPGQLVVLESTTYPGTTEELLRPLLDASGLEAGRDYFLAFSPEREDPGNPLHSVAHLPKVVGGADEAGGRLAALLYETVVARVVEVSSAGAAEATKLTENVFRAVNIALVNELKIVFDAMGIDIWEVLDAAETKPFGFMRFNPGPGWGGHCIPLDPFYLSWKAREHGVVPHFIELAGETNSRTLSFVLGKITRALNDHGKAVKGSRLLLLGLAYKKDVDDPRESPAFELLHRLLELGAEISYHDPHIPRIPPMRSCRELPLLESQELSADSLGATDGVIVVTDHRAVDYDLVLEHAPLVVDTRGVFRKPHPKVVRA